MDELFVTPEPIDPSDYLSPDRAKVAGITLSAPPTHWDDEILQNLYAENAYIPQDKTVLIWKKKDPNTGFAVGEILVQGTRVGIPVIISNRELKPLDVMIRHDPEGESDILPLSERNFLSAQQEQDNIGEIMRGSDIMHRGWNETAGMLRFPSMGRFVYASALGASEDQKAALQKLVEDKKIAAGLTLTGNSSVLEAWLNSETPSNRVAEKVASLTRTKAYACVLGACPETFSPEDFKAGQVINANGEVRDAVRFEARSLLSDKVAQCLIYSNGDYCRIEGPLSAVVEDNIKTASEVATKVASYAVRMGDTVSFMMDDGQISYPQKVASIEVLPDDDTVRVTLDSGVLVNLTSTVKRAMKVEDKEWVIPGSKPLLVVKYASAENRPADTETTAKMLASSVRDSISLRNGRFDLKVGTAINQSGLTEHEVLDVCDKIFSNSHDIVNEVKRAAPDHAGDRTLRFTTSTDEGIYDEKVAEVLGKWEKVAESVAESIRLPLDKAVKLAAVLSDERGADAVLGLGMLTKDNMAAYSGLTDQLDEITSKLARLLLHVRLGPPSDVEETIATAVRVLDEAGDKVEQMSASVM